MLIVHIGLPKTATTTLQRHVFEKLACSQIDYIGVFQPRSRNQSDLYRQIYACISNSGVSSLEIQKTKEKLFEMTNSNCKPLVFSEEMVSVDSPGVIWQEKYRRLAKLLDGLEYQVVVTVREPVAAIYSLYVEFYARVKKQHPSLLHFYQNNNNSRIYRYSDLYDILSENFGVENLCFLPFEALNNTTQYLMRIQHALGLHEPLDINLANENRRVESKRGYRTQDKDLIKNAVAKISRYLKNISFPHPVKSFLKSAKRLVGRFSFKSKGAIVPFPSEEEIVFLESALESDSHGFSIKTGVHFGSPRLGLPRRIQ